MLKYCYIHFRTTHIKETKHIKHSDYTNADAKEEKFNLLYIVGENLWDPYSRKYFGNF